MTSAVLTFAVLALQLATAVAIGNVVLRVAGYPTLWRRLPELCLLCGVPAFGLCGYVLLALTTSAASVLPGVAAAAVAGAWLLRQRNPAYPPADPLPDVVQAYLEFRRTLTAKLCWASLLTLPVMVLGTKWLWLTGAAAGGRRYIGTNIVDDLRVVGFPISLAAFGYPLHHPASPDATLAYPLGPFQFAAGVIALWPRLALPAAIADSVTTAVLYGCVIMLAAAWLTGRNRNGKINLPALLLALSCTFSATYNLGRYSWLVAQPWYKFWFGYAPDAGISTYGGTALDGLIWEPNHSQAFSAYLSAALLASGGAGPVLPIMLCAFGAAASMDLTIWAVLAAAIWIGVKVLRRRPVPWNIAWPAAMAAVVFVLLSFPSLFGQMDGLKPRPPSLENKQWLVATVINTHGIFLLTALLAAPLVGSWKRVRPLILAAAVPLAFVLAFHWGSFWFWRGTKLLNPLLALLCAAMLAALRIPRARVPLACLWIAGIGFGVANTKVLLEWYWFQSAPLVSPQMAEGIEWVYANTALNARVAAWRPDEGSLVPSTDYLRSGYRAGKTVFDRPQVIVGYARTLQLLTDIDRGIALNDYVISLRNDAEFEDILRACQAPAAFENPAMIIYRVEGRCRARLSSSEVSAACQRLADKGLDLMKLPDPLAADEDTYFRYGAARHELAGALARRRAEALWSRRRFADAAHFLERMAAVAPEAAEVHYSWAVSLQSGGQPRPAVTEYNKAFSLGYPEFWIRYTRGTAFVALGEKKLARADLERAVALDPAHTDARAQLAALRR
jgi:tetratricopeptide (TPR) repeat protein